MTFKPGKDNFCMFYDYRFELISVSYTREMKRDEIYFESGMMVEKAIKEIGEERIKKYYLGVMD